MSRTFLQCAAASPSGTAEQLRGASPTVGHSRCGTRRKEDSGRGDDVGDSTPNELLQAAVRLKPTTADVVNSAAVAKNATATHTASVWLRQFSPEQAATPRLISPVKADNAAAVVSRAGATLEVVHGGGGCTSGCGPFVKMSEQPELLTPNTTRTRATLERMSHLDEPGAAQKTCIS